jgi:hypothetical protein
MYFLTIFFIGRAVALFSPAAEQQRASHPRRCRHRFSGQEKEGQVWKGLKDSLGIGTSHPGFARLFPEHGLAGSLAVPCMDWLAAWPFLAWIGGRLAVPCMDWLAAWPFRAWIGGGALPFRAWIGWQLAVPCMDWLAAWPFHAWIGWQPGRSVNGLAGALPFRAWVVETLK